MAKLKIHAGDFLKGQEAIAFGAFSLRSEQHMLIGERISFKQLAELEIATEESVKRLGGTVGWGAVGALALGPVGFLAGALMGGRGKDVTFVAKFKDGRRLMATTDSKTFTNMQAAVF
ncbi:hypothetical protein ACN2XU_04990 [Primorskyibacter sp. 2E107]|uniref:hypothetical protein n=1 Tax=Primorskyibacter sp. 2E107 TaxID=3403458 RepID=UPI003AF44C52